MRSQQSEENQHLINYHIKITQGIILMNDIPNIESFNNLNEWIHQIRENSLDNITIILVGNNLIYKMKEMKKGKFWKW